jgi:hypothetical protein
MDVQSRPVNARLPGGLDQRDEGRDRKLRRNDLDHSVIEHLVGQRQADAKAKPLLERGVSARCGRTRSRNRLPARRPLAARPSEPSRKHCRRCCPRNERRVDAKDVRRDPECDLTHRPKGAQARKRQRRRKEETAGNLRRQAVQAEIHEAKAESQPPGRAPS